MILNSNQQQDKISASKIRKNIAANVLFLKGITFKGTIYIIKLSKKIKCRLFCIQGGITNRKNGHPTNIKVSFCFSGIIYEIVKEVAFSNICNNKTCINKEKSAVRCNALIGIASKIPSDLRFNCLLQKQIPPKLVAFMNLNI